MVIYAVDVETGRARCRLNDYVRNPVLLPEHLVHQRPDAVDVLFADLDEAGPALGEELARHRESVAQIGEVGMDAVAPGIPEGLHLFGLAGEVVEIAILDVARGGRPLEVRVEADAVGGAM